MFSSILFLCFRLCKTLSEKHSLGQSYIDVILLDDGRLNSVKCISERYSGRSDWQVAETQWVKEKVRVILGAGKMMYAENRCECGSSGGQITQRLGQIARKRKPTWGSFNRKCICNNDLNIDYNNSGATSVQPHPEQHRSLKVSDLRGEELYAAEEKYIIKTFRLSTAMLNIWK